MVKLRLGEMLKKKKLSKMEFARRIGIHYPTVFRYFRPGYDPKLSSLERWAKAIGCQIKDLFHSD